MNIRMVQNNITDSISFYLDIGFGREYQVVVSNFELERIRNISGTRVFELPFGTFTLYVDVLGRMGSHFTPNGSDNSIFEHFGDIQSIPRRNGSIKYTDHYQGNDIGIVIFDDFPEYKEPNIYDLFDPAALK